MATKKNTDADNVYTTDDGRKIRLKQIDPIFLQAAIGSVKFPEKPTYEAKTAHGNVEVHEMDEVSAEQTPGGIEKWKKYQAAYAEAAARQNEVSLRAMFLDGTERPKSNYLDKTWMHRMSVLGIDIPDDPDEAWIFYLQSSLKASDIVGLTTKIMRLTGVSEEAIQEAEDSFRDSILDESGENEVSDSE